MLDISLTFVLSVADWHVLHTCTVTWTWSDTCDVRDLLNVDRKLWIFAHIGAFFFMNHSFVCVVFRFHQPEIVIQDSISALATKHVKSFVNVLRLGFFLT